MINDAGLAALTLLVAESDPKQKDVMIRLIMNMLSLLNYNGESFLIVIMFYNVLYLSL